MNVTEGDTVKVTYTVVTTMNQTDLTINVDTVNENSFVGGAGIGVKVTHTGLVYAPTSSDGFKSDGDSREKIGMNAEWESV